MGRESRWLQERRPSISESRRRTLIRCQCLRGQVLQLYALCADSRLQSRSCKDAAECITGERELAIMRSSAFKTKSGPEGVLRPARAAPEIAGCFTSDCGETSSGIGFAWNSFFRSWSRSCELARRRRGSILSVVAAHLCAFPCLNLQRLVHFSKVECPCT